MLPTHESARVASDVTGTRHALVRILFNCGSQRSCTTELGWLLSGPLSPTEYHNIVSTNLIVTYSDYNVATTEDEIVDTLKRFWELEAIGIADFSVDQQPVSKILDHITSRVHNKRESILLQYGSRDQSIMLFEFPIILSSNSF